MKPNILQKGHLSNSLITTRSAKDKNDYNPTSKVRGDEPVIEPVEKFIKQTKTQKDGICFLASDAMISVEQEATKMIHNVPEPDISPDFTIKDIHKIRAWNYERLKDATKEERIEDVRKRASEGFAQIETLRAFGRNSK